MVCLAVPLLHNDPSQYENPEKCVRGKLLDPTEECMFARFDMTRFSKERAEDTKNSGFCWLPYGTGSKTKGHRCASEKLQESIIKMFGVMAENPTLTTYSFESIGTAVARNVLEEGVEAAVGGTPSRGVEGP